MQSANQRSRKSIRLPAYDYTTPGAYFVTLVAAGRACLFGQIDGEQMQLSAAGRIADECWRAIPQHFPNVELGAFTIMPNHLHGILVLHDAGVPADVPPAGRGTIGRGTIGRGTIGRGTIYRAPTVERYQHPVAGSVPTVVRTYKAAVTRAVGHAVWQRNYYEHIIRDEIEWSRIHLYIEGNVANWNDDEENAAMP